MSSVLLLFEDDFAALFEPVALCRSVAQLRVGAWTHRERWERVFPDHAVHLLCRGHLADVERQTGDFEEVITGGAPFVAGELPDTRFVAASLGRAKPGLLRAVKGLAKGEALFRGTQLVAARSAGTQAARLVNLLAESAGANLVQDIGLTQERRLRVADLESLGFTCRDVAEDVPQTLADLVSDAADAITEDFGFYSSAISAPSAVSWRDLGVHLVHPERIRLGEDVRLDPGVVLDASEGPILLGPKTHVMANAVIYGPVAIGPRCLVKPTSKILHGVCVGPVCKLGGEIEGSIVQGYSNKQHEGFLGHSYLGSWVNLGAATDTSDLKNNYGTVRIRVAGVERSTGSRHVGSFFGDHSKTGIHTMLNTGTVVGAFSNLFGGTYPPKEVPSFSWGGDGRFVEHDPAKAIVVAATVMSRRGVDQTEWDRLLARLLHSATEARRKSWLWQFDAPDGILQRD